MYHPALAIPLVYNGYDGLEGKTAGNPWISTEDYKAARPEWLERREELSNDFRALMDFQEKHKIGDYYKNKCITLHSVVRAIDWLLDYPYPAPVYWIKGHCYHTDGRRCALYTSHYDAFMKRFGDTADKDSIFYPPPVEGRPPNRVPELLVKEGAQAEWLAKREELTSSFNDFHAWIHRRGITLTNAALGGHAYKRVREVDLMMDYPDPAPMVDREGNHLEGPLDRKSVV